MLIICPEKFKNGKVKKLSPTMKLKTKTVIGMLLDYAIENSLIETNCTKSINTKEWSHKSSDNVRHHKRFTDEELKLLWDNYSKYESGDMLIIDCYSGWRPSELCELQLEHVDLINRTFTGGLKTQAGKNRMVPIHPKIYDLVVKRYKDSRSKNSKYLFTKDDGQPYTYHRYLKIFVQMRDDLNIDSSHALHDCRVTFISLAKRYMVNEYAIKHLVGHAIADITENVYTQRDPEWLKNELEKIK